jgi:hypothetical protein
VQIWLHISMMRRIREELAAAIVVVSACGKERRGSGGSIYGHQVHYRDHNAAFRELCRKYFDDNPEFDDRIFR